MQLNKLDPLLALRGFACITVVITHCFGVIPPEMQNTVFLFKGVNLTFLIRSSAWAGVWIFFCLSGYLMGKAFFSGRYSLDNEGVLNFWKNRFIRIWPLYYFNVLILFIFVTPDILKLSNWTNIYASTPLNYDGSAAYFYNGGLWSVATEFQFYLIVPFLFVILHSKLKSNSRIAGAILSVILAVVLLKLAGFSWHKTKPEVGLFLQTEYKPLYYNLDLFLTGFLLNAFVVKRKEGVSLPILTALQNNRWLNLFMLVFIYIVTSFISFKAFTGPYGTYGKTFIFVLPPLTALLTAFYIYINETVTHTTVPLRNKALSFSAIRENPWRIAEVFGLLSYGIYVWHGPIVQSTGNVFNMTNPLFGFFVRFISITALSTLIAAITYIGVEKPAERFKRFATKHT